MLHAWSSAHYSFPLPPGHRFPVEKYTLLRARVLAEGIVAAVDLHDPGRASRDDLLLVHTADYVDRVTHGELSPDEVRKLGFPWSEALVERSYRATGGTIDAAPHAVANGVAMNLAGGTHHAFPDHGEGFCVFNDVAVGIRALQRDGRIERATVVDLAGADPHERDRLGRLGLTFDGLARRDVFVLEQCREVGTPIVVTIAGGYGEPISGTVEAHTTTARIAARYSAAQL